MIYNFLGTNIHLGYIFYVNAPVVMDGRKAIIEIGSWSAAALQVSIHCLDSEFDEKNGSPDFIKRVNNEVEKLIIAWKESHNR